MKKSKDLFGARMKEYEFASKTTLIKRAPKIIRLDGRAFHTFLADAKKPFDKKVMSAMILGAKLVMQEIGGSARFAYIQSDEVSIAINDAITLYADSIRKNHL